MNRQKILRRKIAGAIANMDDKIMNKMRMSTFSVNPKRTRPVEPFETFSELGDLNTSLAKTINE